MILAKFAIKYFRKILGEFSKNSESKRKPWKNNLLGKISLKEFLESSQLIFGIFPGFFVINYLC